MLFSAFCLQGGLRLASRSVGTVSSLLATQELFLSILSFTSETLKMPQEPGGSSTVDGFLLFILYHFPRQYELMNS